MAAVGTSKGWEVKDWSWDGGWTIWPSWMAHYYWNSSSVDHDSREIMIIRINHNQPIINNKYQIISHNQPTQPIINQVTNKSPAYLDFRRTEPSMIHHDVGWCWMVRGVMDPVGIILLDSSDEPHNTGYVGLNDSWVKRLMAARSRQVC